MNICRKCTCIAVLAFIVVTSSSATGQETQVIDAELPTTPLTGDYAIPMARHVRIDSSAQKKVMDFIHAQLQEQKKIKEEASRVSRIKPDSADDEKGSLVELRAKEDAKNKRLHAIIAMCKETEGTDAGLTAVLLFAAYSSHDRPKDQRPNLTPLTNVLENLHQEFPNTWQGKVAPLLQATLMKEAIFKSGKRTASSLLPVITWLTQNMPSQDEYIDLKKPDIEAFCNIYPLQTPVRANYLRSIAYTQFQMGSLIGLEDATKTCGEIIRFYPESDHSKWAKWLIEEQIMALRETIK